MCDVTSLMADSRIGLYEISRIIGKGNFAIVRLARHIHSNTRVALKCIDVSVLDREQRNKLRREIEILQRVQRHNNVLRLYEVLRSERHVILVTEYCSGGELFEHLVTNGRMSEVTARAYFRQIVAAVEFLHSRGIVHRDLKAENLLLSSDLKRVILADFGFSNYYNANDLLSTWCGSPPYAAPELFEGKRYSGPRADIWSLGVVLYVLTCGALPFDGTTLQSLRSRVLQGKFRIPYFMSGECEHLLRQMLVVCPEKRASIEQIKVHKWMDPNGDSTAAEPQNDEIDSHIIDWTARELNIDTAAVVQSVQTKAYDAAYGLYHLVRDCTSSSAPPSPPLLPILPPPQRKSSITTGIVERTPQLFLTPPTVDACNDLVHALRENFPITNMDLLKPPPTFLIPQMGRRASDGQANYPQQESRVQTQSASAFHFTAAPLSSSSASCSASRKRHSLTEQRHSTSVVRRRASDGGTTIAQLQSELYALCVSSPPSLHTSPQSPPSSPPLLPSLPEHTVTPPQAFRSTTPTLTLTDSDGIRKFPIIPPPPDFVETIRRHQSLQHLSGSDSFIFEEETAKRLRLETLLAVKETEIAMEWIDTSTDGRRLILRRVSGDANVYRDAVMAMVAASVES